LTRPGPAGARWTWADSHPAAAEALESAATADPSPVVRKKASWYIAIDTRSAVDAPGVNLHCGRIHRKKFYVGTEALLAEANGAQQTLNEGLRLVTPLIGAGLFALAGGAVVAEIDAATFLVAVAALLALRDDEPKPAPQAADDGGGRMTAGFRFIRREPVLRSITLALALAMLAFGFTESAVFSVVTTGLHHRPTFTGVLLAAQGTGVVLAGFVGPWVSVAAITAIQRRTPSDLLGRVAGAFGLSLTAPQVASVGLGAALIAVVSYRMLLFAVAVVAVVAALAVAYLLSRPETRHKAASEGPPGWHAPAAPG
jgi:hypothetical protein